MLIIIDANNANNVNTNIKLKICTSILPTKTQRFPITSRAVFLLVVTL